jgi:hypothetical protein
MSVVVLVFGSWWSMADTGSGMVSTYKDTFHAVECLGEYLPEWS